MDIAPATEAGPKPARRLLRLTVRTLMLLVLVLAVILGWVVRRAHIQREAVAAIEKRYNRVRYNWEVLPDGTFDPNGKPGWPKWLVDRLGLVYFGDVVEVVLDSNADDNEMEAVARFDRLRILRIRRSKVTDAGLSKLRDATRLEEFHLIDSPRLSGSSLAQIRSFPRLRLVELYKIPIADADLVYLEGMSNLEVFILDSMKITDKGLAHLRGLTGLKRLTIESSRVTDAGLTHLRGMTRLEELNLGSNPIADAGLSSISNLGSLRTLSLFNTRVTDVGVSHLSKLTRLKNLKLNATRITDAGLTPLLGLDSLETLGINQTKVTDAGLLQLTGLNGLRSLDVLGDTGVSAAGLARFGQLHPSTSVISGLLPPPPRIPAAKTPPKGT